MNQMASVKKIVAIIAVLLLLTVIVLGALALSDPVSDGGLGQDLIGQSPQPDMVASVSESYVNRMVQAELEKSKPDDVEDLSVSFIKNGSAEVLATMKVPLLITSVETRAIVNVNISVANGTLKFEPSNFQLGNLGIPSLAWKATIDPSIKRAEDAANLAAKSLMQEGFKITGVQVGDRYIVLTINALSPGEMKERCERANPS